MACPLCGDGSVTPRSCAPSGHELALLVAEMERGEWMEHLRMHHPADWAREHARETEMNAHLGRIFGGKR
jgi:hypothetical protein